MEELEERIKTAQFAHGVQHAIDELALQIIEWTAGTGARGGVVGLSGGIDSTTVAYLTKYAFDKYNAENPDKEPLVLLGLIMPSKVNDPADEQDGVGVAKELLVDYKVISIEPIAEGIKATIPEAFNEGDVGRDRIHSENCYSEARAIVLSRFGARYHLRIMGTGNHDEDYVLGYFTKRGDGAVDNNILGNLPTRLVRELARGLGVPEKRVRRVPTAGLSVGQTDEGDLGFTYETAEKVMYGIDSGHS